MRVCRTTVRSGSAWRSTWTYPTNNQPTTSVLVISQRAKEACSRSPHTAHTITPHHTKCCYRLALPHNTLPHPPRSRDRTYPELSLCNDAPPLDDLPIRRPPHRGALVQLDAVAPFRIQLCAAAHESIPAYHCDNAVACYRVVPGHAAPSHTAQRRVTATRTACE